MLEEEDEEKERQKNDDDDDSDSYGVDNSEYMRSMCPDCGMMIGHEGEPFEITKERHSHCPSFLLPLCASH